MSAPQAPPAPEAGSGRGPGRLGRSTVVQLGRAAHPRRALVTAAGLAVAGAGSGRALREVVLVLATALVGQALLGWDNDLVDESADREAAGDAEREGGRVD